MTEVSRVVVVGLGAAGLATAEALRRKGYTGAITLLGAERHAPYDRPPLSKQILSGAWETDRAALRPPDVLARLDAELRLDEAAVALNVSKRVVETDSGARLEADAVVIATGARPRQLPGADRLDGMHVLRTLDDALALRAGLGRGARLAVVGEGVLGSEIAATARTLGADVTLAGPLDAPMALQVGPLVSRLLGELHEEQGVRLRLGEGVAGPLATEGRVRGIQLQGGDVVPADVVVIAIGATPDTGWLTESGLSLGDGVVCDAHCRAAEGVYAVGDVARWHHEGLGRTVRLENRTNATEQAIAVAGAILGEERPYVPVPYFWTDQYDAKLQVHGLIPPGADAEVVEGEPDRRRFVVRYTVGGKAVGVLGWNMPKQARLRRAEILEALGSPAGTR
ncbi:NAD(P)/FAD-dependent oxidoreductase [Streptomyces sp. NPDC102364]|uniref:NAD(P)/FAD-dependent oxidoreductase n=1 Tax=Streptomyces sp. NPDC102364 TaxID=3366161 RepID=UPI003807D535